MKENLTTLKILTAMQLGDKTDITVFTNKKRLLISVLIRILLIAFTTALMYAVMYIVQNIIQMPVTSDLLLFVLMLMQIMGIVTYTLGLMKTLYQGKDNALLLSYPVKHTQVFLSKVIVYYLLEFMRNVMFLLPFMLAFGIFNANQIHWSFYLNSVVLTVVLPVISVLISAVLSLPAMFVTDFLRGHTLISSILLVAFVGAIFYLLVDFINSLPTENFSLVAYYKYALTAVMGFLQQFGRYGLYLICARKILEAQTGTAALTLLANYGILLAVILVVGAIVYFLTMPFYFRIASHAVEMSQKRKVTQMKVHKTAFSTFFAKELKMTVRDSSTMIGNFIYLMLMPFLLFLINKIFSLINTNVIGNKILMIVNVCLGLTMVMLNNTKSATAISSEGSEFYLLKTAPDDTSRLAWAKIAVNLLFSTVSIIASVVCIYAVSHFDRDGLVRISDSQAFFIFLTYSAVNLSHMLWSFEFDLLNPQVKEYIATGTTQNSTNANKSMALGVALAFMVAAALGILLFAETVSVAWIKFFIIIFALLGARIYLFVTKLKLYFNDIEM